MDDTGSETGNNLFSKKNIITAVVIVAVLVSIPIAVILVQKVQRFQPRATVTSIVVLPGPNITQAPDGSSTTTNTTFSLQLNSGHAPAPTPTPIR